MFGGSGIMNHKAKKKSKKMTCHYLFDGVTMLLYQKTADAMK